MIRVVIDTNILVSALLTSGGLSEAVINLAISGEVQWFTSESVLAEYEDVLKRPRLAIDAGKADDAMAIIRAIVSIVSPAVRVAAASDPDDNHFLECAEAAHAHYLGGSDVVEGITGVRPNLLQKPTYARKQLPGGAYQFFSDAVIGLTPGVPVGQQSGIPWGVGTGFFGVPTINNPVTGSPVSTPGDLGRNTFIGPAWWNFDLSLIKDTHITERTSVQFRAEFFNVMNHSTFGTPNGGLGSTNFGLSTYTATTERQIQFGLHLMF